MSSLWHQLREDRAIRDAARALLKADVAHLRNDLQGRSIGGRMLDRINEGAREVFDEAVEVADNNRGVLAALLGALMLWFTRQPVIDLFASEEDAGGGD